MQPGTSPAIATERSGRGTSSGVYDRCFSVMSHLGEDLADDVSGAVRLFGLDC